MPKGKVIASSRWFFMVIAAIVLFVSWLVVKPLAITLITAAIFSIALSPIERKLRVVLRSSKLSSLLLVFGTFVVVLIPIFVIAVLLVSQAQGVLALASQQDQIFQNLDITSVSAFQTLPTAVQEWLLTLDLAKIGGAAANWAVTNLQAGLSDVVRIILNAAVFFVALYYMLHDREKIRAELLKLSPFKDKLDQQILQRITSTIRNVVVGALIVAFIQGVFAAIGMTIFGVPGALLWGALAVIAAQIPLVGVGLIMVPAVSYLLLTGHVDAAIGLAIWAVVVVGLVDNIISPFLIQGRTKMHALLILVSILGGLQLFGPIGIIMGPTVLAGLLAVTDLYKAGMLEAK